MVFFGWKQKAGVRGWDLSAGPFRGADRGVKDSQPGAQAAPWLPSQPWFWPHDEQGASCGDGQGWQARPPLLTGPRVSAAATLRSPQAPALPSRSRRSG